MNRPSDKPVMLCVDDDPAVLRSLERLFREEPVEFLSTEQPEQALRWVEEHDVRLLVTDQRMPGMPGIKLVEEILCRSPRTACVILTAWPLDTAVLPEFLRDTYVLVTKPWDGAELKSKVREIFRELERAERKGRGTSPES
jgi:DNA-binding NtrC family response regulator